MLGKGKGDEKYDKIRAQRWSQYRGLCLLGLACLFVLSVFYSTSKIDVSAAEVVAAAAKVATGAKVMTTNPPILTSSKMTQPLLVPKKNTPQPLKPLVRKVSIDIEEMQTNYNILEQQVRSIKATGVIMETDAKSLTATGKLQISARLLTQARYGDFGNTPYRIQMDLQFQESIPDFKEKGASGILLMELAPISLIPVSVYNFLEVARGWKSGGFHRNAGHVLQAEAQSTVTAAMPFQEYSTSYPHTKGTIGYCGRPSGPCFYVSIIDNTRNHGPGSQQNHNPHEADCIIGKVIGTGMEDVVNRIKKMPGEDFLENRKDWVLITAMHILVPGEGNDGYVEWRPSPIMSVQ